MFIVSQHCSDEESGLNACTSFSNYIFLPDTIVSRSQTAFFSFSLGREKKGSQPNDKEKKAVWLRETSQILHEKVSLLINPCGKKKQEIYKYKVTTI